MTICRGCGKRMVGGDYCLTCLGGRRPRPVDRAREPNLDTRPARSVCAVIVLVGLIVLLAVVGVYVVRAAL